MIYTCLHVCCMHSSVCSCVHVNFDVHYADTCPLFFFHFRRAVNNTCKMLMALGIGKREVYEDDFEKPFLRESREFFRVSLSIRSITFLAIHYYCIYMYEHIHVHVRRFSMHICRYISCIYMYMYMYMYNVYTVKYCQSAPTRVTPP